MVTFLHVSVESVSFFFSSWALSTRICCLFLSFPLLLSARVFSQVKILVDRDEFLSSLSRQRSLIIFESKWHSDVIFESHTIPTEECFLSLSLFLSFTFFIALPFLSGHISAVADCWCPFYCHFVSILQSNHKFTNSFAFSVLLAFHRSNTSEYKKSK